MYFKVEPWRYLSVYSSGPSHDVQLDKLGVYELTHATKNGKPTWRNKENLQFIYLHGMQVE